jgi:hypothetical protein
LDDFPLSRPQLKIAEMLQASISGLQCPAE